VATQADGRTLWPSIIPVAVLFATLAFTFDLRSQSDRNVRWTEQHYNIVLNDLLPMEPDGDSFVVFRQSWTLHAPTGEAPESYAKIGFIDVDRLDLSKWHLSAVVKTPESVSIYDQILTLHRSDANATVKQIESRIKFKELRLTEAECVSVRSAFQDFQNLQFGPPKTTVDSSQSVVVMDPTFFRFHIQAEYGSEDITLLDDSHPLVKWAAKTIEELERCGKAKGTSATDIQR